MVLSYRSLLKPQLAVVVTFKLVVAIEVVSSVGAVLNKIHTTTGQD